MIHSEWTPYHSIPDGCLWCPHHYTWGLYLLVAACLLSIEVYRRRDGATELRKPSIVVAACLASIFGWFHLWQFPEAWYHIGGPILALTGSTAAFVVTSGGYIHTLVEIRSGGVGGRLSSWDSWIWDDVPQDINSLAVIGSFAMLDDVLEHTFGLPTPLDVAYKHAVHDGDITTAAAVVVVFAVFIGGSHLIERWRH